MATNLEMRSSRDSSAMVFNEQSLPWQRRAQAGLRCSRYSTWLLLSTALSDATYRKVAGAFWNPQVLAAQRWGLLNDRRADHFVHQFVD